jgi:peptidoglycan hydrolase-like protein with peptidoglycan-binding domain
MKIELSKPFASNGIVDEYDVIQMKKVLNRLGYYQPYEKIGITDIADKGVFEALKAFQKDHTLPATGTAKPDDGTVKALNKEAAKTPHGQYIWRTVEDEKVRKGHAQYNRTIRNWSDSPDPGEDFNCRCWAEPVERQRNIYDPPIRPVYPELLLLTFLPVGRGAIGIAVRVLKTIKSKKLTTKSEKLTEHGKLRMHERKIMQAEIEVAIKTARKTGNIVTKVGKYGTPQNVYTGSNGVTVVEETTGRNAGKIITSWRH